MGTPGNRPRNTRTRDRAVRLHFWMRGTVIDRGSAASFRSLDPGTVTASTGSRRQARSDIMFSGMVSESIKGVQDRSNDTEA